jgi:hypothetical protein
MLVQTSAVQSFLGSKGFTRDESEPFTLYAGYKNGKEILVIDESGYYMDLDFLIEDAWAQGASKIAAELEKWREELLSQPSPPSNSNN